MATKTDIEEQIYGVIATMLKVKRERLTADTRLREDLGADSLDLTEIVMELEAHFGIKLNTRDTVINTVAEVIAYLRDSIEAHERAGDAPAVPQPSV